MSKQHRLLAVLGTAFGALIFAAIVSTATAHADDCAPGQCTLVPGGDPTDVVYGGLRPLLTNWQGTEPIDVQVTGADGTTFDAGHYDVAVENFNSPWVDNYVYTYGDFVPASASDAGYSEDLSGVKIYDTIWGPGPTTATSTDPSTYMLHDLSIYYPDGTHYDVLKTGTGFENIMETSTAQGGSADYIIQPGQDTPVMLWNSLDSPSVPVVPDVVPPDLLPWD